MPFTPVSGFFTRQQSVAVKPQMAVSTKLSFVNVGGTGDCGFRSVAACLIDDFLFNRRALNQKLFTELLARYFDYFPQAQPFGRTALERMENMVRSPLAMAECTRRLAYVLRQIAVDELCENPENYRSAFITNNRLDEEITFEQRRKESTPIDESLIAALSNRLELPIEVQVVTATKELPLRLQYNVSPGEKPPVVMQLQHGHYISGVSQPARFKSIREQQVNMLPLQPVTSVLTQDPPLSEVLARIKAEDGRLLAKFNHTTHQLVAMVNAGEVSKDDLIAIYVKGLAKRDDSQGRVKYVGVEHGNQRFFEVISNTKPELGTKAVHLSCDSYNEQIINELIDAIARAISVGQLDPAIVFAQIEHDEEAMARKIF